MILGESKSIINIKKQIINISESDSTVMIYGPTGSGKEVIAQSIHNISRRKNNNIIEVNCAAIPDNLLESELFGYDEGTFTGAKKGGKIGKFEMANGGTLFLDEIDQLSYQAQPKLLRVLQEHEVTRIGGTTVPINVRIIAATNKNLKDLVKQGKFREDLYYRLNVIEIKIPPLKDRKEDIPILAYKQLKYLNKYLGKNIEKISDDVMNLFYTYNWPGNVRELNNIIERAMNNCKGNILDIQYFKEFFTDVIINNNEMTKNLQSEENTLQMVRDKAEKEAIIKALDICGQNKIKAAKFLKISRANLYIKMEKFNIK